MNFDLNMLSTLMQLMGKQPKSEPPRATEPPAQTGQRVATSSFVLENGIGEKVRLDADNSTPSPSNANPLAGILELMGGKSGGADGMSAIMPMLMGLLGKSDQGAKKSAVRPEDRGQTPTPNAQNSAARTGDGGHAYRGQEYRGQTYRGQAYSGQPNMRETYPESNDPYMRYGESKDPRPPYEEQQHQGQHQPSAAHGDSRAGAGMYAPISYAGYSLISALNLLYRHVYERQIGDH